MSPVIVALDFSNLEQALQLAKQLNPQKCRVKVGKELFTQAGPEVIRRLHQLGFEVFLDLKFHDIPNTCAQAVLAAAEQGVWMVNLHASGGLAMMQEAKNRLLAKNLTTKLIAVTVLTSMQQAQLNQLGVQATIEEQVINLASLAKEAGLDGVVCSALEAEALTQQLGKDFLKVTPGIRPATASLDDQHRVMTPAKALAAGSTHLVIGRPITQAATPPAALEEILAGLV